MSVARIADVVIDKELIESCVLHHTGEVGAAEGGEIVVSLDLVAVAYRLAAFLRIEIAHGQRAGTAEGVNCNRVRFLVFRVDGVHGTSCIPVVYQLIESQFAEQWTVEGVISWLGVAVVSFLNGAAL